MDPSNEQRLPDIVLSTLLREPKDNEPLKTKNQKSSHNIPTNDAGYLDLKREDEETVLIKLPPGIWGHWLKELEKVEDEDAPIRLGTVWVAKDGTNRVKLDLDDNMVPNEFPTIYDLNLASEHINTYVFTEKDSEPGGNHEWDSRGSASQWADKKKSGGPKNGSEGESKTLKFNDENCNTIPANMQKDSKRATGRDTAPATDLKGERLIMVNGRPYPVRQTKSSRTAYFAKVTHALAAMPTERQDFDASFFRSRNLALSSSRQQAVQRVPAQSKGVLLQRSTLLNEVEESRDISESIPIKASKRAPGNGALAKTAAPSRKDMWIPLGEEELKDKLFKCFKEYKYWSFRELQEQLEQPQGHLMLVLEEVATRVSQAHITGRVAKLWCLKKEYRHLLDLAYSEDDFEADVETGVAEQPGLDH